VAGKPRRRSGRGKLERRRQRRDLSPRPCRRHVSPTFWSSRSGSGSPGPTMSAWVSRFRCNCGCPNLTGHHHPSRVGYSDRGSARPSLGCGAFRKRGHNAISPQASFQATTSSRAATGPRPMR